MWLGPGHSLWQFLSIACAVLAVRYAAAVAIARYIRWRHGPEGESKMLSGFVGVMAWLTIIAGFIYSLGLLGTIGGVAALFAGTLLGWSLQAPVSGVAAWALVTLKRPFRIGDRVLFPSIGLTGDVKAIGPMYTVLDQVGGAIGSEEAIGRDILIPNAILFQQVAINYTPKAQAAFFLDEVVIRITYDSDWDAAEKVMLEAARTVTADIIRETGHEPYIRSDIWDYGILMRLRYMTKAKDRPRITHEIVKLIFKSVQRDPRVDMAIPFVYSFRKSMNGFNRDHVAEAVATTTEVPAGLIDETGLVGLGEGAPTAEMEQLVRNIQEHGLLQPVIVAPLANCSYRIVAGHKRYLACRWLGWKNIPVLVHQAPDARIPTA